MKWGDLPYKTRLQLTEAVLARDGWICCICNRPIESRKELSIEHKIKQRHGGTHELSNLGPAHRSCNSSDRHDLAKKHRVIDNAGLF